MPPSMSDGGGQIRGGVGMKEEGREEAAAAAEVAKFSKMQSTKIKTNATSTAARLLEGIVALTSNTDSFTSCSLLLHLLRLC